MERRIFSSFNDFGCPRFHAQAAVNEELRFTEMFNSLRRRLEFMGLCPIGDEGVNIDFITAYGLGELFQASKVTATFNFPSSGTSAAGPQPARPMMHKQAARTMP